MYDKIRILWRNILEKKYKVDLDTEFRKRYSEEEMLSAAIEKSEIVKDKGEEESVMATFLCLIAAFTALSIKEEMEETVSSLDVDIKELIDSSKALLEIEEDE